MTIEGVRDLVIIIAGIIVVLALAVQTAIGFSIYRRAHRILDSAERAMATVEKAVNIIEVGIIEPLTRIAAILKGVCQGLGSVSQMFKGGKNGE